MEPCRVPAAAGHRGALVWRGGAPFWGLSAGAGGGGLSQIDWALNIGVASDYGRTDLVEHAGEVAAELDLSGAGVAMFTAVDLSRSFSADCEGVLVDATVGISHPTWAADSAQGTATSSVPGTINLVVRMPVALDPGAAVNAVITVTEAKAQALGDRGVPGTGTATDAVTVTWPSGGAPERFAGPRSQWGSRLGQAVYRAVWSGAGPRD